MKKPITAQELFDFLFQLQVDGEDLKKININYRYSKYDDPEICTHAEESTENGVLSVTLKTRP